MYGTEAVVQSLLQAGIPLVAGVSGDSVMAILDALYPHQDRIRYITVRHEQVAASMADGYARASRKPMAVLGHVGPGVCNLVIGIASAHSDSVPMLVITGAQESAKLGRDSWHEIDQLSLLKPITKWQARVNRADEIPRLMRTALNQMVHGRPGPVHIDIPKDIQKQKLSDAAVDELRRGALSTYFAKPRATPDAVKMAADLLLEGHRPIILAGGGTFWSGAEAPLRELAEMTGIPVITGSKARGVLPEDHPLCIGPVGHFGIKTAADALADADTVLAVGSRLSDLTTVNWTLVRPDAKLIQVNIDPGDVGRQYPVTLGIIADARLFLQDLVEQVRAMGGYPGQEASMARAEEFRRKAREEIAAILANDSDGAPVKPQRIVKDVMATLDRDAFKTVAGGIHSGFANKVDVYTPGGLIKSTCLAAMGTAFPYALGAKLAFPQRQVVALIGDGDFAMVMQDLETAVREKIPVIVVVSNDSGFSILKVFQNAFYGGRIIGSDFSSIPFYKFAELVGAHGERVDRGEDFRPALERALGSGKPAVLDVYVDRAEIGPSAFTVQRFHAHTGG